MLGQRRRRWTNIETTLIQRLSGKLWGWAQTRNVIEVLILLTYIFYMRGCAERLWSSSYSSLRCCNLICFYSLFFNIVECFIFLTCYSFYPELRCYWCSVCGGLRIERWLMLTLVIVLSVLYDMASHKFQKKLSQLFYCHQNVIYNRSKVIISEKNWNRWWDSFPTDTHV